MIADAARQHPPPTRWRGAQQITKPPRCKTQFYFSVRFGKYRHPSGKTLFYFSVRFCKYRHPSGGGTEWSGGRGGLTLGVGRRRREPMIRRDP